MRSLEEVIDGGLIGVMVNTEGGPRQVIVDYQQLLHTLSEQSKGCVYTEQGTIYFFPGSYGIH